MSKERSFNNKVDDELCDNCKELKWRVTVDASDWSRSEIVQTAVQVALMKEANFSLEHANRSARAVELLPTPDTLIYAGDKTIAFAVLDHILALGVDAGITSSKKIFTDW